MSWSAQHSDSDRDVRATCLSQPNVGELSLFSTLFRYDNHGRYQGMVQNISDPSVSLTKPKFYRLRTR